MGINKISKKCSLFLHNKIKLASSSVTLVSLALSCSPTLVLPMVPPNPLLVFSSLAVIDSSKIFQGLIPIIMAGILGIYGVIISVIANAQIKSAGNDFGDKKGYTFLGAGLSCGLS